MKFESKDENKVIFNVYCKIDAVAVNIYSHPSNSLLIQMIDSSKGKKFIKLQDAVAKTYGNLKEHMPRIELEKNYLKNDNAISIELVTEREIRKIVYANVPFNENFSISTTIEPEAGGPGKIKHCGCCGIGCNPESHCIYCSGPQFTLCCPQGTIFCGHCNCPCQE